MKISPSMLACDFTKMGEEIIRLEQSGADMIHMDVLDGRFVPNISFGACIIKSLRNKTPLPFDVHLMIEHPYEYVTQFVDAGADIITFHIESKSNVLHTIQEIKKHNKKVGIAINPSTAISKVYDFLEYIDLVLVMTVNPGFGGQAFMPEQLTKVTCLKQEITNKNLNTLIEIDGGINLETISTIKKYPVDICVSGTCILKSPNMKETIRKLKTVKDD